MRILHLFTTWNFDKTDTLEYLLAKADFFHILLSFFFLFIILYPLYIWLIFRIVQYLCPEPKEHPGFEALKKCGVDISKYNITSTRKCKEIKKES